MPRHESPRSPLGSTTSKRSHRDDDYHERSRRDDGRSHRHRSRTRSPENRYDRDYRHHRDRSRDRYRGYDGYRSGRRDRSERRRSRDRDGVRERRRSRDRDAKTYRDDSRNRARRRREDDSRERPHKPSANGKQAEPSPTPEQIQAERQKKLEEWKRKQAAERERKQQEAQAAGGARSLLAEIDKKTQGSPAAASPKSPTPLSEQNGATSPAPYAGPFDHKAIAKKVTAASASSNKLGALPEIAKVSAMSGPIKRVGLKANNPLALANGPTATAPVAPRAFGLSSKANAETERAKPGLDFGDDEGGRKKLEKLEDITANEVNEDAGIANSDEDDDSDNDEGDDDNQEFQGTVEEIEARRQRLEDKREERLQAQEASEDPTPAVQAAIDATGNVAMTEALNGAESDEVEEDTDPLDAFMADIEITAPKKSNGSSNTKGEALFFDDDVELEAVDDDLSTSTIKRSKKKDIPASVSGRNVTTPFRKNFYKVPSELESLTEEDVLDVRHELGIKVKGNLPIPIPVQSFSSLGLNPATYDCIQTLGYKKPSGIQSQAIPAIMSGRDVLGIASTGSGKTLAFLLPMFRHLLDQRPIMGQDGPIALVIAPTRELASQIAKEGKIYFKAQKLTAVTTVGGNPIKDDIGRLKAGASIVVGTPGRLLELLQSGRLFMTRLTYLVIDEADRMLDMGFEPQIRKIIGQIRPDCHHCLISATFPKAMASLAATILNDPIEIVVGGKSVVAPNVSQKVLVVPEAEKFGRLLGILGDLYERDGDEDARCLVFVEKQESCDNLMVALLRKGYPCSTLHGGKDQVDRDSTIADFKAGVIPVLIATSVAARGLDVPELRLVVQYTPASHLEDFVHRSGRTGRAGRAGKAITLIQPDEERYSIPIAKALRDSKVEIPPELQKLVDSFNEKVKSGKEKASGSGFGGKGLERLDQERDAARARERKTHKTGDEPDEDENEDKGKDDDGDDLITKAASSVQAASAPTPLAGVPKGIDLDGKIVVHKTEGPASASNVLDKVGLAINSINDRLSKNKELRQGVPIDNKGPDAGAFHATLEINDFPQKARWAVTNRTNVAKILDSSGTSITTKGSFYAQGKEPGAGENPKLYILVEGDTEVVVTNAMRELMRLLKEGTIAAADSDARAPTGGRYNVV